MMRVKFQAQKKHEDLRAIQNVDWNVCCEGAIASRAIEVGLTAESTKPIRGHITIPCVKDAGRGVTGFSFSHAGFWFCFGLIHPC